MEKVKIITDSNSGITKSEAAKWGVFSVKMPIIIDGEEFFEEDNLTHAQFFDALNSGADVKTSQPSAFLLEEIWTDLLKEYDRLLYIPMSSGLSGTFETALKLSEKFNGKVLVVDNKRISLSQKESVLEALAMAKQGKSLEEIKDYLEKTARLSSIYIMVNELKYLKKGGRISAAAALVGSTIKLKPILYTRGDKFEKASITISIPQAKKIMLSKIAEEIEGEFKEYYDAGKMVISVAHTENSDEALRFKELIISKFPNLRFRFIDPLSLSVSCHIGKGALAVCLCINSYL